MNTQQQIILSLLRANPAEAEIRRVNALGEGDWQKVLAAAEAQGLATLLFGRIQKLRVVTPPATQAHLREVLLNNTARNLQLIRHFEMLAGALQGRDVPFMPLKGIYLCTNVYENLGERSLWDIDLIVPRAELGQALAAIEGTGYRPSRPYDLELEIQNYHHVPVYVMAEAPLLEVHWSLLNPRFQQGLDWGELWERSILARIGGASVRVLAPDDLVIYLCAHVAYQHMYIGSIRSLYDIQLVLKVFKERLDWDAIAQRATTWGLQNSLYLTLHLVDELVGPALPESIRQRLCPPGFDEALTQAAITRLLEGDGTSPVVNAVWARRSFLQRVKGLWGRIAVPRSVLAGRYGLQPNSLWIYPYYLVRAWDLLRIHGGNLMKLLVGNPEASERAARDSALVAYLSWWK